FLTDAETTAYGLTPQIYIEVKSVDTFGGESAVGAYNAEAGSLSIKAADMGSFAVTASKIFTKIPVLEGDTWTDDAANGFIGWNAHKIYYNGVEYNIAAGVNVSKKYVYWVNGVSAYATADTIPTLSDGDFLIATNVGGLHDLAWNAIANQVIGSAFIADLAVKNQHVEDIAADKLTAGIIQVLLELKSEGKITVSEGADIVVGDTNITLDSTNNQIVVSVDGGPDEETPSVGLHHAILKHGELTFHYWNGTEMVTIKAIRQVDTGLATVGSNGTVTITTEKPFIESPKIAVVPANMPIYNKDYAAYNQRLVLGNGPPTQNEDLTWNFDVTASLYRSDALIDVTNGQAHTNGDGLVAQVRMFELNTPMTPLFNTDQSFGISSAKFDGHSYALTTLNCTSEWVDKAWWGITDPHVKVIADIDLTATRGNWNNGYWLYSNLVATIEDEDFVQASKYYPNHFNKGTWDGGVPIADQLELSTTRKVRFQLISTYAGDYYFDGWGVGQGMNLAGMLVKNLRFLTGVASTPISVGSIQWTAIGR
ncbi:MAG: hypothetical protein ABIL58_07940, partial [Pseudomonadota bacterium]